jgi:hypothetical protein
MADIKDWSKICDRIYVWDYATNYAHTAGIFPDFGVLQRNVQIFYENNVAGVYEEGNYYMYECDGEFGELRAYLLSKLMQNPYIDYSACMNEFLEAFYGKGWQNIRQFIDMTIEKPVPENKHLGIYIPMAETLGFTEADIEKADALWQNAKNDAETDVQRKNVERSEICWRYWKGFNVYNQAENDKLLEDMIAFGITKMNEGVTTGPESFEFTNTKATALGNNILFPVSIALYAVAVILALAVMILALRKKPRKFVYILLPILIGAFIEIFGWHKRAYIAGVSQSDYILTFALIAVLFAVAGALMPSGKKQRLLDAILCPAVRAGLYFLAFFIMNSLVFDGGAKASCLGAAYILTTAE